MLSGPIINMSKQTARTPAITTCSILVLVTSLKLKTAPLVKNIKSQKLYSPNTLTPSKVSASMLALMIVFPLITPTKYKHTLTEATILHFYPTMVSPIYPNS